MANTNKVSVQASKAAKPAVKSASVPPVDFTSLASQVLQGGEDDLTFNIADCDAKASSTGNVGFRVELSDGQVVTFWSSNWTDVVEAIDEDGNYRLVPGTTIAKDGGLIPAGGRSSFWK